MYDLPVPRLLAVCASDPHGSLFYRRHRATKAAFQGGLMDAPGSIIFKMNLVTLADNKLSEEVWW